MRSFCSTYEESKWSLKDPFQQGSLTYASDTRRIIRGELTAPEISGERRLPDAAKVYETEWQPRRWFDMDRPALESLVKWSSSEDGPCPACHDRMISHGKNYDLQKIADWEKRGVRWDVDENVSGDESCEVCKGTYYKGPCYLPVGRDLYAFGLLAPIWDFPGQVRFAENRRDGGPLLFEVDGFQGMVMPMKRE
jgi:hypothetical protein